MFQFVKRRETPDEAVTAFLADTIGRCGTSFEMWQVAIVRALQIHGLEIEQIAKIMNSRNMKQIHLCSFCGLEDFAIRNCFNTSKTLELHEALRCRLLETFSGNPKISQNVFDVMDEIQTCLSENLLPPERAIASAVTLNLLTRLELHDHNATTGLLGMPMPVLSMFVFGACMETGFIGWWKTFSKTSKLSAP